MAQRVNIQERLKMRFLTVDYRDKQEVYGTSTNAADTGTIALEILNISDSVLGYGGLHLPVWFLLSGK